MKQPAMPYRVTIHYPVDRNYDTMAAVSYITEVTKWCEQQGLCLVNDFGVDSLSGSKTDVDAKRNSLSWHFKFRTHQHATMFKLRWGGQ